MNSIMERLTSWGCDTAEAMKLMSNDESFYIECLRDVAQDPYFDTLKEALEKGDAHGAFNAAHTLKGVLSNVGLTPIYDKIVEIVEPLREGSTDGTSDKFAQLIELREHLRSILD